MARSLGRLPPGGEGMTRTRQWLFCCVALLWLACGAGAADRDEPRIAEARAWTGPSDRASFEKIQREQLPLLQWLPGAVQPLGPGQSLWLAVKLTDPVRGEGQHVLELPLPILDQVSVWQ